MERLHDAPDAEGYQETEAKIRWVIFACVMVVLRMGVGGEGEKEGCKITFLAHGVDVGLLGSCFGSLFSWTVLKSRP